MTLHSHMKWVRWALLLCVPLALMAGCSSTGTDTDTDTDTDTTTDTSRASAADCETTEADALVSTTETDDGLAASAVTSGCGQVAVYKENGELKSVSVSTSDGEDTVTAEFDSLGQMVVARDEDSGDKVTASYNEGLSYARVSEDIDDTVSASIVSVERDSDAQRSPLQNAGETLDFCAQLEQMIFILGEGCDGENPPARCDGPFAETTAIAEELCSASDIEEFGELEGLRFDGERDIIPLGVDGFVTTRPAAEGTTFILASVPFGGLPPYTMSWSQLSGETTTLSELPGGAAVGDSSAASGGFEFKIEVTDAAGDTASATVGINLGEEFIGVVAQASELAPDVDEVVQFFAAPAETLMLGSDDMLGGTGQLTPGTPTSDFDVYWDFGDGSPGVKGEEAEHAYTEAGVYTVSLIVVAGACDFNDYLTVVVGGADDGIDDGDTDGFAVTIVADNDALTPGSSTVLSPQTFGGVEPIEFGWGIVEGHDNVAALNPVTTSATTDIVFSDSVELETLADANGLVVVGVVAVDATGRVAEAVSAFPMCGADGGLFAEILGPWEIKAGESLPLNPKVIDCGGDTDDLNFSWSILEGSATLSDSRAAAPSIMSDKPGEFIVVQLRVSDDDGRAAEATIGILVLLENFGDLFAEFLGPHEVPLEEEVPTFSFIAGGEPPYFCHWHLEDGGADVGAFIDPFSCEPAFKAATPGCVHGELRVEDTSGAMGLAPFEICSGEFFSFDCPPDGNCDPSCPGFDPDCGDPCPFDGTCDEECPIMDPDCFEDQFCVGDDGICDAFCADTGNADSDCDACGADGVCVFFCEIPDPDCDFEPCSPGDGICDLGCPIPDPDCGENTGFCVSDDGICDPGCSNPDPDCPDNNDGLCLATGFCCDGDEWCDPECPTEDLGCGACAEDGECVLGCFPQDPDCGPLCDPAIDPDCPCDPFMDPNCTAFCGDGICDFSEHCAFCPQDCGECIGCVSDSDCDDFDSCTDDFCDVEPGTSDGACFNVPNSNCNPGATCADGTVCDDGDDCTLDHCDEAGVCHHDQHPDCGGGDDCVSDADCQDPEPCTIDYCDTATGICMHDTIPDCGTCMTAADCDDFDPCTIDDCDMVANVCTYMTDPNCGDDNVCPDGTVCDDADPCTDDSCDSTGNCTFVSIPGCSGSGGCTSDAMCDDGDACTIDTCDTATGACTSVPNGDPNCNGGGGGSCMPDGTCDAGCNPPDPDCGVCGNAICDAGETNATCPQDCPQ